MDLMFGGPPPAGFHAARGTPIGRYFVEGFLRRNADYVRGRCLEFGDARYKSFFPHSD